MAIAATVGLIATLEPRVYLAVDMPTMQTAVHHDAIVVVPRRQLNESRPSPKLGHGEPIRVVAVVSLFVRSMTT